MAFAIAVAVKFAVVMSRPFSPALTHGTSKVADLLRADTALVSLALEVDWERRQTHAVDTDAVDATVVRLAGHGRLTSPASRSSRQPDVRTQRAPSPSGRQAG